MTDISQFAKGLIESTPDPRDFSLSSVSPVIMRYPEICPPPFDLTITNQGANPSCVGHSVCGIKQEKELRERNAVEFDAEWFYKECKKIDGLPNMPGTYFRTGMQVLKNLGAKPLNGTDPSPYKISHYALIDDMSFEGLKKAIFLYGAVLVGFRGSNEGWQGEYIKAPKEGETIWGHAVRLVGYEQDYLIGENSWGKAWGNQGMFKVSRDYLPFEGWAVILDAPTEFAPVKTAWVANQFIKFINGSWQTTANVNARSDAGTSFSIIKTIPKGTIVLKTNAPTKSANGYVWENIIIL